MTNNNQLPENAPAGSHFANALAFIVESLSDDNAESTHDIQAMDIESRMEFAEMYNFTEEAFQKAYTAFRQAYLQEEKVMRDL